MSDPKDSGEPQYVKWFRTNYPTEMFLFNEITNHMNMVYAKSKVEVESIPIDLYQAKKDAESSQLLARDSAIVFYGVMAKTIIDQVSKSLQAELGPKLLNKLEQNARKAIKEYTEKNFPPPPHLKRCQKCNYDNEFRNQYCGQCGAKL